MCRAAVAPCAFTVICPKCGEPLSEPETGSQLWEDRQMPAEVVCGCGAKVTVQMPKKYLSRTGATR